MRRFAAVFLFLLLLSASAVSRQISLTPVLEVEGPSGFDTISLTVRME